MDANHQDDGIGSSHCKSPVEGGSPQACVIKYGPRRYVQIARHLLRFWFDHFPSDVFCMHIRAQNAALIVRRLVTTDVVQFEVFEVLPLISDVMKAEGKLLCSYPGPAVQIPADIFADELFLRELSSFLIQMDVDHLDSPPTPNSPDSNVYDGAHPRYISELLVGI